MGKTAIEDAKRLNAFLIDPARLKIVDDPSHPLCDASKDREAIDEALVKNIMVLGVKETILVRKEGEDLVVVNGRRRTRHAVEANKRLRRQGAEPVFVNVKLEKGDDATVVSTMIATNRFRLDDGPLESARKAQKLIGLGRSTEDVAVTLGVTSTAVRQWLQLLELAPAVQKAVERGEVSASAAAQLHGLKREEQVEALDDLKAKGGPVTAKVVKRAAAEKQGRVVNERPGLKELRQLYEASHLPHDDESSPLLSLVEQALLGWILGEVKPTLSLQQALKNVPKALAAKVEREEVAAG